MTELRRKPEIDYYKVLQVDPEAEPEVIEAAYRALSKKYHPDINRAPESMDRMAQINAAYTILNDASKRRDYNYLRNSGNKPSQVAPPARRPASPPVQPVRPASPRPAAPSSQPKPSFTPSTSPKPEPVAPPKAAQNNSFRPQATYPNENQADNRVKSNPQSGLSYAPSRPRGAGLWLGIIFGSVLVVIGLIIGLELILGNPLKTSFIKQPAPTVAVSQARSTVAATAASTPQPAILTNREQITAFLNTPDLFANRVSDVGLTRPDVLQLRLKLATGGGVLNADSGPTAGRTTDDLDLLRQAEATGYNLIYTLFERFTDLNRINLVLLDSKDKPFYRADVSRQQAFTFYGWHTNFNLNDPAEVTTAARQDRLLLHFGVPLDEATRARLTAPTEATLQAELQNIGLSAFSVAGGASPVINYFQVRSQAETAVDFARILYTLYTRFPTLDRLQIIAASSPDKPSKVIDRQLFNQVGLDSWSQAAYGGSTAGGDRQAQSLVAALPGNPNDLKPLPVLITAKFKSAVQVDNWAVVAENVERFDSLSLEGQKFPAGKDRQFLVVRVALRNSGSTRQWLLPGEKMSLTDTKGPTVYTPDPAATLLYDLKTPPSDDPPPGPIEAGKQDAVYVVFNIPANTNLATLHLQFQSGDKKALFELS